MKNYKKEVEAPKLVIQYDTDTESPREWDNLGYFITVDRNYNSPDNKPELVAIVKETGDMADSQEDHITRIKNALELEGEKVLAVFPITKYEHGGVSYSLGTKHGGVSYSLGTKHGFDNSNNGFYIVTEKSAKGRDIEQGDEEEMQAIIKSELETYNKYANGEVYGFTLYDDNGEMVDSCWGFYDIEDIREHLPEEWKDEDLTDYIK